MLDGDDERTVGTPQVDRSDGAPPELGGRTDGERETGCVHLRVFAGEVFVEGDARGLVLLDQIFLEELLQVGIDFVLGSEEGEQIALANAELVVRIADAAAQIFLGERGQQLRADHGAVALDGDEIEVVGDSEQVVG